MAIEDESVENVTYMANNIVLELNNIKNHHRLAVSRLKSKIDRLERKIYSLEEELKDKNLIIGLHRRDSILSAQKIRKLRNLLDAEEKSDEEGAETMAEPSENQQN